MDKRASVNKDTMSLEKMCGLAFVVEVRRITVRVENPCNPLQNRSFQTFTSLNISLNQRNPVRKTNQQKQMLWKRVSRDWDTFN